MTTARQCAHCSEHYALAFRAGRNSAKAKPGRERTYHQGRRYCSERSPI